MTNQIPSLPIGKDLESKAVLKRVAAARSALAEMKGAAASIPNDSILIDTLSLQEAKDSSAIENIITTHDELFQSDYLKKQFKTMASKEVQHYAQALRTGFRFIKQKGLLTTKSTLQLNFLIGHSVIIQ